MPDVSVGSAIEAGSVVCIDTQKPDIQKVEGGAGCAAAASGVVGRTSTFEPRTTADSSTQVKFGSEAEGVLDSNGESEVGGASSAGPRVPPAPTTPAPPGIMKKRVQIQEISV